MAFGLSALWGGAPRALSHRPQPLRIGEAARAREMLAGRWRLAGAEARGAAEAGPWRLAPPTPEFAAALHGFGWLDDLAAADTAAARRAAQSWSFGWIALHPEGAEADAPEVAARRLTAWAEHAGLILRDASADLERRFAGAMAAQAKRLARAPRTEAGTEAAAACLLAELCLTAAPRRRARAAARLGAAAVAEIGEDGGVAGRNPEALAEALGRLAGAARHLRDAGAAPNGDLDAAVARAAGALRAIRMRDGGLPRFHGGGMGAPGRLDQVLALAGPAGPDRRGAMGFTRLAGGRVSVVVDAAPPPAGVLAQASTLAFEMAAGPRRLVVNCGPGAGLGGDWAAACRATAAQSTLSLDGVSSSRIAAEARGPGPHPFAHGVRNVGAETAEDLEGSWFLGAHDGWLEGHGLIHARRLFLSPDGRDFRGEDRLEPPEADPRAAARAARAADGIGFAVRFLLSPEVAALARPSGDAVRLELPEGAWEVSARGGALSLAEGAFIPDGGDAPAATRQILVSGRLDGYSARITWGFRRL